MRSIIRPADWPIATKLVVAFLIISLLPIIAVSYIGQQQARDGLLKAAQLNLQNTAQRSSHTLNDLLNSRLSDVQQSASSAPIVKFLELVYNSPADLGPHNSDQINALSQLQVRSNANDDSYFFIADKSGHVWLTSSGDGNIPDSEARDVPNEAYFTNAYTALSFISDPTLVSNQNGQFQTAIYYSAAIRDPADGAILGVLVERSNISDFWITVEADNNAVGNGSYSMLVDPYGIVLADSRTTGVAADSLGQYLFRVLRTVPSTGRGDYVNRYPSDNFTLPKYENPLPGFFDRANQSGQPTGNQQFFATTINSEGYQAAFNKLVTKNWTYFVVVPDKTYGAAADQFTTIAIVLAVIVAILVILIALVLSRVLTIPIRAITRVLGRIGIGDFDARVPVTSSDELGHLGEALNAMFDNTLTLIQTREERDTMQEQITRLLNEISTVAEGDLTIQAEVTADITGAIADSFNLMIEELRKIILNIQSTTNETTNFLDQLVQNSARTDKAAEMQANKIMGVNVSITDLNKAIQQVSEGANRSAQVAQEARANAGQGGEAVTRTIGSMNRIRSNVQETSKKIKRLGESSQQIGDIVKLIDDIADQTNMLALNAAIQATAAGEQGKGFSVVAEEVRRLAERSAKATREIASLVKSIQDDTAEAVVAMEESTREVVDGSRLADDAGRALSAIETVVDRLANLITTISQLSQQQTKTSSGIALSMGEIAQLTQEATQLRAESAEAVAKVALAAAQLNNSVSAFRLPGGMMSNTASLQAPAYNYSNYEPVASSNIIEGTSRDPLSNSQPFISDSGYSAADGGSATPFEESIEPGWDFDFDNKVSTNDPDFFEKMLQETLAAEPNPEPSVAPAPTEEPKPRKQAVG